MNKNKIATKINNYNELSKNLINDLQDVKKIKSYNASTIQTLGQNILFNTMKIWENFLHDKN